MDAFGGSGDLRASRVLQGRNATELDMVVVSDSATVGVRLARLLQGFLVSFRHRLDGHGRSSQRLR